MVWTYWNWVTCNTLVGIGIVTFVYLFMGFLLWRFHQIFYSMIAKLFNIKRCVIDVNNKVVQKNSEIFTSSIAATKGGRLLLKIGQCVVNTVNENPTLSKGITTSRIIDAPSKLLSNGKKVISQKYENQIASEIMKNSESESTTNDVEGLSTDLRQLQSLSNELNQERTLIRNVVQRSDIMGCCWSNRVGMDDRIVPERPVPQTKNSLPDNHPSHPEYIREVLNVYGKFLTLNKKRNKFLIMTIAVIVISSVLIAGFQGCLLANVTVYQDGSCPFYGVMECFYGPNASYFQCSSNDTVNIPFGTSATCFRWIVRDTTVSDVMTQIGACTGLLAAFGASVEVLIRFLFFAFQQRPGVSAGIRRMLEKTVGINKITQPTRCCGFILPFHFGVLNLQLYRRPWLVLVVFIIYALLPLGAVCSIVLLSYFKISITALTYIVLITVVSICLLGLLWIVWEEDEIDKILPGSWSSFSDVTASIKKLKKYKAVLNDVIPEKNFEDITNFADDFVSRLKMHADEIYGQLNKQVEDMMDELPRQIQNKLLTEVEQLTRSNQDMIAQFPGQIESELLTSEIKQIIRPAQDILSNTPNFNLHGAAQNVRERKSAERMKDIGNIPSRKN